MDTSSRMPSLDDITAIIALDDQPLLRNLKITQCYHDFSHAITTLVGAENVNWCTFATWASKTAGGFIRYHEISAELRAALGEAQGYKKWWIASIRKRLAGLSPEARTGHTSIFGYIESVIDHTSSDIAAGNLKVFAELGPLFCDMVTTFAGDTAYDGGKLEVFLRQLKGGPIESGGQDLLRDAVTHFYGAMFETDPHRKAEQLLLANALTGLHEQKRLQPHIAGAIEAPIAEAVDQLHAELSHHTRSGVLAFLHSMFDVLVRPLIVRWLKSQWDALSTRYLMTLTLPDGTLHLGVDLPAVPGHPLFPAALQEIDDDALRELLASYGAIGTMPRGIGTKDWVVLFERMRYILELFRSRQQDTRLFAQPFTDDQRKAIAEGRIPDGEL